MKRSISLLVVMGVGVATMQVAASSSSSSSASSGASSSSAVAPSSVSGRGDARLGRLERDVSKRLFYEQGACHAVTMETSARGDQQHEYHVTPGDRDPEINRAKRSVLVRAAVYGLAGLGSVAAFMIGAIGYTSPSSSSQQSTGTGEAAPSGNYSRGFCLLGVAASLAGTAWSLFKKRAEYDEHEANLNSRVFPPRDETAGRLSPNRDAVLQQQVPLVLQQIFTAPGSLYWYKKQVGVSYPATAESTAELQRIHDQAAIPPTAPARGSAVPSGRRRGDR